jgi:hypothetical protein
VDGMITRLMVLTWPVAVLMVAPPCSRVISAP